MAEFEANMAWWEYPHPEPVLGAWEMQPLSWIVAVGMFFCFALAGSMGANDVCVCENDEFVCVGVRGGVDGGVHVWRVVDTHTHTQTLAKLPNFA